MLGRGLKLGQRKVLFACFKKGLKSGDEIKVVQLAGYVSEVAAYHHGETALQGFFCFHVLFCFVFFCVLTCNVQGLLLTWLLLLLVLTTMFLFWRDSVSLEPACKAAKTPQAQDTFSAEWPR